MRTLLRVGRQAVLIRIDSRRGAQFLVGGPRPADRRMFIDAKAAIRSFEDVERGVRPAKRWLPKPSFSRPHRAPVRLEIAG
jgi:hypothetical protein